MTRFQLHPENPEKRWVQKIADLLNKDGVGIIPLDSGYGIGCSSQSPKAVKKLYQLIAEKKYTATLIFQDFSAITDFAKIDNYAFKFMKQKLPGPYTFILPATNLGRKTLQVKRPEMGVRYPEHVFLTELYKLFPHPLVTVSAKVEEDEPQTLLEEVEPIYGHKVDFIADLGPMSHLSTTIISFMEGNAELLRQGDGI
jgi:tRNA threonylcarbamoyl adenosine modification protein (Sua5/YciO/YrdC/YwlC family)